MQVKKWAADYPGWHLTTLFLAASNFVAAPTGGSTLKKYTLANSLALPPTQAMLCPLVCLQVPCI